MPRRAEITPRPVIADPVYDSTLVTQLMNRVMLDGKKSRAEAIVYGALDKVGERTGLDLCAARHRYELFFAPYLERACLRSVTPEASRAARITL